MIIETKYNIGDDVWCANFLGEPFQLKIYGITIKILGDKTLISYYVGLTEVSCTLKKESLLFPTKEELLKSL